MEISARGLALIKSSESFRAKSYLCPADVWTIGYGTTSGIGPGMTVTRAQAESLLRRDLIKFQVCVSTAVRVPLTQGQYDALVSLCYNIGEGAFKKSTLLKLLNQKRYDAAARQFDVWVNAKGKKLPGLVVRRAAEQAMFRGVDAKAPKAAISPSETIEPTPPKPALSSRTLAGVGTAATLGGGAVVDQVSDLAGKHASLLETILSSDAIGIWLGIGAALALVYVTYRYLKDREERV